MSLKRAVIGKVKLFTDNDLEVSTSITVGTMRKIEEKYGKVDADFSKIDDFIFLITCLAQQVKGNEKITEAQIEECINEEIALTGGMDNITKQLEGVMGNQKSRRMKAATKKK